MVNGPKSPRPFPAIATKNPGQALLFPKKPIRRPRKQQSFVNFLYVFLWPIILISSNFFWIGQGPAKNTEESRYEVLVSKRFAGYASRETIGVVICVDWLYHS